MNEERFDRRQLEDMIRLRGMTQARLCREVKDRFKITLSKGTLSKILSGETEEPTCRHAMAMLAVLEIPKDALSPWLPCEWEKYSWNNLEHRNRVPDFRKMMECAEVVLTLNGKQEMFLVPDDLVGHEIRDLLSGERLKEWWAWIRGAKIERSIWRKEHNFQQISISRLEFFSSAVKDSRYNGKDIIKDGIELIDEFSRFDSRRPRSKKTAAFLATPEEWNRIDQVVHEQTGHRNFDKVTIVDDAVALVRPSYLDSKISYHRPTVIRLREAIEAALPPEAKQFYRGFRPMVGNQLNRAKEIAVGRLRASLVGESEKLIIAPTKGWGDIRRA